jgi:hypothetical protein
MGVVIRVQEERVIACIARLAGIEDATNVAAAVRRSVGMLTCSSYVQPVSFLCGATEIEQFSYSTADERQSRRHAHQARGIARQGL